VLEEGGHEVIGTLLRSLRPLWREAKLFYYEWAIVEIDPLHPDVPKIVHAINTLKCERLNT
jgi:hypothetical protein